MTAPIATKVQSKLPFDTISAPSQYPNGVMYLRNSATSAMFAIRFKKYIILNMFIPMKPLSHCIL